MMGKAKQRRIWIKGFLADSKRGEKGGVTLFVRDETARRTIAIPGDCYVNKRMLDGAHYCCIDLFFKGRVLKNAEKFKALEFDELQRLFETGTAA